ncbi:hypothetical protein HW115_18980 [Verrucomicrobiaceae bacterium N1E253]|uniref:Uncharacterized protein n=1 Tax=Oceaniferula marina TaxID=2748318 RepID=A0A851GSF2_9BACT|nr:hypothetical protein [Oceaniferula marina]NWK57710.1 hypothetical protein [Oceaniferula marina]
MSAKSEDEVILKLLLKGQSEQDILAYLKKHGMVDDISIYRVRDKVLEMKAAQAFLPSKPPKKRIRSFALLLIIIGASVAYYFKDLPYNPPMKGHPAAAGSIIMIIGVVLFIWPSKGVERI